MKIFYHGDDDGRCSAAIVKRELVNVFEPITMDDFIEYFHSGNINTPEFKMNETVYIVDLALDDVIYNQVIKPAVDAGSKVIHIDHHKTTLDRISSMTDDEKLVMEKITSFYKTELSASMLTWVYSLMYDSERKEPNKVNFDFTQGYTHVGFNVETPDMREYRIPDAIRYIDDNDVWRHEIEETKFFSIGFQLIEDKHPASQIWDDLIYTSSQYESSKIVNDGRILWTYQEVRNKASMRNAFESDVYERLLCAYQEAQYKANLRNAFESDVFGPTCLCLNSCQGNSRIFCEKFDEYQMVCKFGYDGSIHKWRYTLYSSDKNDNIVDVSDIAKHYGGGGNRGAAGFVLDYNIFDKNK